MNGRAEGPFFAFWNALAANRSESEKVAMGQILGANRMAARPTAPAAGAVYAGGQAPTFRWTRATGCMGDATMRYAVRFVRHPAGTLVWQSPYTASDNFTPTAAQLRSIFGGENGQLAWNVLTRDLANPASGIFPGARRTVLDRFTPAQPATRNVNIAETAPPNVVGGASESAVAEPTDKPRR